MSHDHNPHEIRRRKLMKALAASGVSAGIAGCGRITGAPQEGKGDRQYIIGSTSGVQNLSPLSVGDEATVNRLQLLYDGGGVIDDDPIGFQSRWFENWQLSNDATTVRYKLREDLEWGAGYGEVNAETFVWNVRNVFRSSWAQHSQATFFSIGGKPIEYEKTGTYSFKATLPKPRANFLHEDPLLGTVGGVGTLPVPIDLAKKYKPPEDASSTPKTPPRQQLDQDEDVVNGNIIGNLGPFTVDSFEKGSKLVVSKNDDYYLADTDVEDGAYEGSPSLDKLTYQVFKEQSTAYNAIKAGEITQTGVEARKKSDIQNDNGVKLWTSTFGEGLFWVSINHRVNGWAPLRESRKVRQAFAHIIDKDTLINDIYDGNANPIDTFHPRWGPYYSDAKIKTYPANMDKAKTMLEENTSSDYGYDDNGNFVGPDGNQVTLKFVTRSDIKTGTLVLNYVKRRLNEAGFKVQSDGLPFGKILQTYLSTSVKNNPNYSGKPDWGPASGFNGGPWDQAISKQPWDLLWGVGSGAAPYAPWQAVKGFIPEKAPFNAFGYHTDRYDFAKSINQAASANTQKKATKVLEDMFGFLSKDLPYLFTINEHLLTAYRKRVSGLPEVENFFSGPDPRLLSI